METDATMFSSSSTRVIFAISSRWVLKTRLQDEPDLAVLRRLRFPSVLECKIALGVKHGLEPPPESENAPAGPLPAARGASAGRVLLAEDHPLNRKVVKLILTSAAVSLTCVDDGGEAIEACRTCR